MMIISFLDSLHKRLEAEVGVGEEKRQEVDNKRGGGKPQLPAIAAAADMDSRERKISMFRNRFAAHKYSFLLPSSHLTSCPIGTIQ